MLIYHSFLFIFRYIKNSKSKNADHLAKDWPAVCLVKNEHNHAIESAAALKHRDMSEETTTTKKKLCSLFIKGHNPSSALHCLKTDLMLDHGDDYYKVAADGFHLPSKSRVEKLFAKEFSAAYGGVAGSEMFEGLEKLISDYSSSCSGKIKYQKSKDGEHYYVVILTPIMISVHEYISQSKELILVDASGGADK